MKRSHKISLIFKILQPATFQGAGIGSKNLSSMPISKHLNECLDIIKKLKITPFQPIDVFPKIKRGDFVFKQLCEAGYLTKFWVGEEAFYQLKIAERLT